MTHDEGKFFLFDVRTAIKKAAYYQHTRTLDLFCHERYNEYNVLFGYGDGSIKHIDMRKPDQMSVTDSNVERGGRTRVALTFSFICVCRSAFIPSRIRTSMRSVRSSTTLNPRRSWCQGTRSKFTEHCVTCDVCL